MADSGATYKVFVVDDRESPRAAARAMLSAAPDLVIVGEAASGREALETIPLISPDVVLMDVDMTELDGPATTRKLLELVPNVTIVAWTVSDASEDLLRMIRAGCSGYVLKDVGPSEFQRAIRAALRKDAPIPRRMVPDVLRRVASEAHPREESSNVPLTDRERETLKLLTRGFALKQIATEMNIAPTSADTHVRNLYRKLGVNNRGEAINVGLRRGLVSLADL